LQREEITNVKKGVVGTKRRNNKHEEKGTSNKHKEWSSIL
jgi:hypothetical protein